MNTKNLLKNKRTWIIGGVILLFIIASVGGEQSASKTVQPQLSQEQKKDAGKYSTAVYFNQVISVLENVTEAFETLQLMESYQNIWTDSDIVDIAAQIMIIESAYGRVTEITPPNDLVVIHQEVLQSFKLFKDSMSIYKKALDSQNAQLYEQYNKMKLEGATSIDRIVNQFE